MNKKSVQYDETRFTESQNFLIQNAFEFAAEAHKDQRRASGEPYLVHPVAVAETVAQWGLDHEAISAALLHDVVEDTETSLKELSDMFGAKVAELVDGVTKLRLSTSPRPSADSSRFEASNENLRKLLLASTKDFRVMLIKLADRLHNMRTLGHLPPDKRQRIARESLSIYAPLADRLGMGQLKGELEDLAFKHAKPEEYVELERLVHKTVKKSERYLAVLKRAISEHLQNGGVDAQSIEARQKHYYSIYKKLAKVDGDIEKIYDLIAVRIIVEDVAACYQTLGILHQRYKPLIYRIKDYIAVPKPNGYQSLHTTVFAEDGHITEIQIRTAAMHEAAEYGLAAHFFYDQQKTTKAYSRGEASKLPDSLKWVTQLSALQRAAIDGQEFMEGARLELFADHIFVFSPKGDLYDLPEGSTPLDFAFNVHTDVGLRALGAKANGKMVSLDARLENRDVVEIITRREPTPSRDWLGFVVTTQAKNRLRAWFKAASRESNIATGKGVLEDALRVWGVRRIEDLPKRSVAEALDALHMRSLDDLLVQLGDGTFNVAQVIRRLMPDAAKPADAPVVKRTEPTGRILIENSQLPYSLAPCCRPVFPQPLLGYVTRGKGVTVHALGCRNVPVDVERYVTCRWETRADAKIRLLCKIELQAINRIGLISDITGVVAQRRYNIAGMSSQPVEEEDEGVWVRFGIEVPDLFALANTMRQLERLPGVLSVRRVG